jgi:hypothetical protein
LNRRCRRYHRVKIPVETGAGFTGGWVAEGAAIPVQKTAYSTSTEENYKYGVIVPLSEELVTTSDPAALPTINRTVLGGLAKPRASSPGITSRRVLCGSLVHAVLDGHFDRILILSPICPRDLR